VRDFQPQCRYHNIPLVQAKSPEGGELWALIDFDGGSQQAFAGELFVCEKCGYTEFFDNDPEATAAMEKARK
jgi:predicted nucleic-acid-binding Zn-ribbon protein